jgi:hypothetical protein
VLGGRGLVSLVPVKYSLYDLSYVFVNKNVSTIFVELGSILLFSSALCTYWNLRSPLPTYAL